MDLDFGGDFKGFESERDHLPGGVAVVGGDAHVVGSKGDGGGWSAVGGYGDYVVDFERLVDGGEAVEAVGAGRTDIETEVNFGVRTDGCGHTNFIVEPSKWLLIGVCYIG